jgi:hypothetical protein
LVTDDPSVIESTLEQLEQYGDLIHPDCSSVLQRFGSSYLSFYIRKNNTKNRENMREKSYRLLVHYLKEPFFPPSNEKKATPLKRTIVGNPAR